MDNSVFNALQAVISPPPPEQILVSHEISLDDRYGVDSVNKVFKDNILLDLAYLRNQVSDPSKINWDDVEKPFKYEFQLKPNQTFAFHDDLLPEYQGKVVKTTNAHFNAQEGFKTDGYLFGDGVCHLASLLNWVAKDADLNADAPTKHDFAAIPDIDKQYGVAIYDSPGSKEANAKQNLYITNNKDKTISFKFEYANDKLTVSAVELD